MTRGKFDSLKGKVSKASTFYIQDLYNIIKKKSNLDMDFDTFKNIIHDYYDTLALKTITEFSIFDLPEHLGKIRLTTFEPFMEFDELGRVSRTNYPIDMGRYNDNPGNNKFRRHYNMFVDKVYKFIFYKGRFTNGSRYTFAPSLMIRKQVRALYEEH